MVIPAPEFKSPEHNLDLRSPDARTMAPFGFDRVFFNTFSRLNTSFLERKSIWTKLGFSPDKRKRERRNVQARLTAGTSHLDTRSTGTACVYSPISINNDFRSER